MSAATSASIRLSCRAPNRTGTSACRTGRRRAGGDRPRPARPHGQTPQQHLELVPLRRMRGRCARPRRSDTRRASRSRRTRPARRAPPGSERSSRARHRRRERRSPPARCRCPYRAGRCRGPQGRRRFAAGSSGARHPRSRGRRCWPRPERAPARSVVDESSMSIRTKLPRAAASMTTASRFSRQRSRSSSRPSPVSFADASRRGPPASILAGVVGITML